MAPLDIWHHWASAREVNTLIVYEYKATLLRVVDGDTVELALDLGFHFIRSKASYRLLRINASERRTKKGKVAMAALVGFLQDKSLMAMTQQSDSFGRYLVELYADGKNVSDWLVEHDYAVYKVY